MTDSRHTPRLSADDWDEQNFPRPAENDFDRVVERALSRRGFLGAALVFGSGNFSVTFGNFAIGGIGTATLAALRESRGLTLYRTDEDGRVVLETDGRRISVRTDR